MDALELLGQDLEILITDAQSLQLLRCRQHVVAACAGPAVTLTRKMELLLQAQPSRVLTMSTVDDVT